MTTNHDPLAAIPLVDRRAALSFFELTKSVRDHTRRMSLTDAMNTARSHDPEGFRAIGRLLDRHPDLAVRFHGLDDIIAAFAGNCESGRQDAA